MWSQDAESAIRVLVLPPLHVELGSADLTQLWPPQPPWNTWRVWSSHPPGRISTKKWRKEMKKWLGENIYIYLKTGLFSPPPLLHGPNKHTDTRTQGRTCFLIYIYIYIDRYSKNIIAMGAFMCEVRMLSTVTGRSPATVSMLTATAPFISYWFQKLNLAGASSLHTYHCGGQEARMSPVKVK